MNILELYGVVLGDGCIIYRPDLAVYTLDISGNVEEEADYHEKIQDFLTKISGHQAKIKVRHHPLGRSLRLTVHGKKFIELLMRTFELTSPKTFSAKISDRYLKWKASRHIIRGLFETDGSLYFSRIYPRKEHSYPRLEIKTSSKDLASQIVATLSSQRFTVHSKHSRSDRTIAVYLSGPEMLEKWIKEIGFSSQKNLTKYEIWKKAGFYTPGVSLKDRQQCLAEWNQNTGRCLALAEVSSPTRTPEPSG